MSEADLLLTTAEIAVAFAGFAGLISVIGRGSASDPRRAAILLRFALEVSLFVVAFSLIPLLPLNYGVATESLWRI
jgi:Zn-dependent protease